MLVYGGDDRFNGPLLVRDIAPKIEDARFVEIRDAGHLCNIKAPKEFNAAILGFLNDVAG